MKERNDRGGLQLTCEHSSRMRRRAMNQIAYGSIVLLWGSLLILKQLGIIEQSVSTVPTIFAAFGVMLVVGGIHALRREKRMKEVSASSADCSTT